MLEEKDVNTEEVVTPPDEEVVESSTTEETQEPQGTEDETPQQLETPEEPEQQVPYDRFREVNEAKKAAEERERQLMEMLQKQQKPPEQQKQDRYAHLPADQQVFYRDRDERMTEIAEEVTKKTNQQTQAQIDAAQREFARIATVEFQREHPDIKPGSKEERLIVQKMNVGYPANDAYKIIMFDKQGQNAERRVQTEVKKKMQVKKKANVEQSGVNSAGLLPSKRSYRDDLASEEWED